jgi:hypothetical protein
MNRRTNLNSFNNPCGHPTIGVWMNSIISIPLMALLLLTPSFIYAQKTIMRMEMITPEWNGKQVCDEGNGYRLTPINAPAINYSGNQIKDAKYNYVWEQKINNDVWTEVASANNTTAIKGFNPKFIYNRIAGSAVKQYVWRIKVTDIANGNQTLVSEEYSISLASPMLIQSETKAQDAHNTKYSFQITVTGGFANKTYRWKSLDQKQIPEIQAQREDPKDLAPGNYEVTVQDACTSMSKKLNTSTSNTN